MLYATVMGVSPPRQEESESESEDSSEESSSEESSSDEEEVKATPSAKVSW